MRELRYALRRLHGSPVFTIAATLTLAIAIGGTASVFSVIDGVLFKAFPYRDPDRVLAVFESNPAEHLPRFPFSPGDYIDYRAQSAAFTGLVLGVSPHDPGIFARAAATFATVALVAASVPAYRTTRVNPVVALTST